MSKPRFPVTPNGLAFVLVAPLGMGLTLSTSEHRGLQSLPQAAQASISAVLGRDSRSYHAIASKNGLHADNPTHALAVDFTREGLELRAGTTRWGCALRGYGYGQDLSPVSEVAPRASANRVEYTRAALTERYVNGPLGLEQRFVLEAPPGPRRRGELLTLALGLSGDRQPALDPHGAGLTLRRLDGAVALRYGRLSAHDAAGRELPVWLELGQRAPSRLRVDDTGARYPLTIDALVQGETGNAKLTASDGLPRDLFGTSVAIDGRTVVVGMPGDDIGSNNEQGSAYVFVGAPSGWSGRLTETAKLTASDGAAGDDFGRSVSISGGTVVVGARNDVIGASPQGSAYVFVEPNGGWGGVLTETAKLTASDGAAGDRFGESVGISGGTVVVGAGLVDVIGDVSRGAAYVFVEPGGGWGGSLTETAELTASDGVAFDHFGESVSISGATVVVGSPSIIGDARPGSAYVFVEPAGGWGGNVTEAAKLAASDATGEHFGGSVSISGDTVVAADDWDDLGNNLSQGSAYVFVEPIGGWAGQLTETATLTASDGRPFDHLGRSVSISGDIVVVGSDDDVAHVRGQGSAYVFVEPAEGWGGNQTETRKLTARDGAGLDFFGSSVTIDGETVVVGAPNDQLGTQRPEGSAYVFEDSI